MAREILAFAPSDGPRLIIARPEDVAGDQERDGIVVGHGQRMSDEMQGTTHEEQEERQPHR